MNVNEPSDPPRFPRTRRVILRRSFTGGLSLQEWAGTVQAAEWVLRKANVDDGAITAAQRLSINMHPTSSDIAAAMLAEAGDANSPQGARQLHELVGIATHLARQDPSLTPEQRLLISNLTRDLDGQPRPSRDLTEALSNWGHTVFEIAPDLDAHQKRSVARWQNAIMTGALNAWSSVEAPEQQPLDRLWPAIEAERGTWAAIMSRLARTPDGTRVRSDDRRAQVGRMLSFAANQLSAAVKNERSAVQLLDACIRTDFANNLITAHQFDEDHPGSMDTAIRLHQICALTHPPMISELPPPLHVERPPTSMPQTKIRGREQPRKSAPQPLSPTTEPLTRDHAARCARQRDAGIIAEAALDGKPEAKLLTKHATPEELSTIADQGRLAVATLAASAYPWAQKLFFKLAPRNIAVEQAGPGLMNEALMQAAHTFDPSKGSLTTWVHKTVHWQAAAAARKDFTNAHARTTLAEPESFERREFHGPSPSDLALSQVEATTVRKALDQLPAAQADILRAYFGIDGREPATDRQIAESTSVSPSTINRSRHRALDTLRNTLAPRDEYETGTTTSKPVFPAAEASHPLIVDLNERAHLSPTRPSDRASRREPPTLSAR